MGILIGSAVVPISLSMFWARLSGSAMIGGTIFGTVTGLSVWLFVASRQPGGLADFLLTTGSEEAMLAGNLAAISTGGILTIIGSLIANRKFVPGSAGEIWENTRDIDSPLSPWTELYAR